MQDLYSVTEVWKGFSPTSPFQINENCCPWNAKVVSLGEMSSVGRQGAKMPLGVAMGYSFIRAFVEQMEGS